MRRIPFLFTVLLLVGITVGACGAESPADSSQGGSATDYGGLVEQLRAGGATVGSEDEISQPFFSVTGKVISVDGESVQVFEYADKDAAEAEAALISPDGTSVGTAMVTWISTPHFYRAGKMIVLYVGNDPSVLTLLEDTVGPQFAGS